MLLLVSSTLILRPTSSYCVHQIFQGRTKNVAECEGGLKFYFLNAHFIIHAGKISSWANEDVRVI